MNSELKSAFEAEMAAAEPHIRTGQLDRAMRHLEKAHVLGQYYVLPHVRAHWAMLRIAFKLRSLADGYGQAVRIVLGALGSAVGMVPHGNTGRSDVSMFLPMPVNPQIAALIEQDRATN